MILVLAIFAAALGMFQFGYNTSVINQPQKYIEIFINESYAKRGIDYPTTDSEITTLFSLVVASTLVGGMLGGLSAGYAADRFGRKRGLLLVQSFSSVGVVLMGSCEVAGSYEMLVIGRQSSLLSVSRFLVGLCCGFCTGLSPLYVSEIAPVHIRGQLGVVNQLAVTSGILISNVLGLDIILGTADYWPLLLALAGVPVILQLLILPFVPESPRYLVSNRKDEAAGRAALARLRGTEDIGEELALIVAEDRQNSSGGGEESVGIWDLFRREEYRLPIFITICMHLSQQLSGITGIFYYSSSYLVDAGVPEDKAPYATVGIGATMVTMAVVTIPLMDRLGRRVLHLGGLLGMVVFGVALTVLQVVSTQENEDTVAILLITAMLLFVVCFGVGPGAIPWMITPELFPQAPRSAAIAVATLVNWLGNLVVGFTFPLIAEALGDYSFMPFVVATLLFTVLLFYYLPETKGESVDQVVARLNSGSAWSKGLWKKASSTHQYERTD